MIGESAVMIPIRVFTNSKNFHKSANGTAWVDDPRIRAEVMKVRESLESKENQVFNHSTGRDMIAGYLTKQGASPKKILNILRKNFK